MIEYVTCDNAELIAQIGAGNILAISGGRIVRCPTGIVLPVRYGYRVTVDLTANDDYVVKRIFVRGGKVFVKKVWADVYASEVGEVAYQASCYLD